MENFSRNWAERSALKFAAGLRADIVAAVVTGRALDEVNLQRYAGAED